MSHPIRLVALLGCFWLALSSHSEARQRSPFTDVRFEGEESLRVEVEDAWYRLLSIEGVTTKTLVEHAKRVHRSKWQKRIGEDLVDLFEEMGKTLGDTADLELQPMSGGEAVTRADVPVTRANRQRILARNKQGAERALPGDESLPADVWQGDLEFLVRTIDERFAYVGLRDVSAAEVARSIVRVHGDAPLSRAVLARLSGKLLAQLGDGHARVREERDYLAAGYAPFLLRETEGGVVAFLPDRSGFVESEYPYLEAIDGRPLSEWIDVAAQHVAAGSPQLVTRRALERLRWIQDVRRDAGFAESAMIELELSNSKGQKIRVERPVARRRPTFGDWPRRETGWLETDRVGYLRLASMREGLEPELERALDEFAEADAVILDVRGNGGGTRDALLFLGSRFLGPKNAPVVVNVGRYCLPPEESEDESEGHLANRFLWPRSWSPRSGEGWSRAAKKEIDRFAKSFRPEGELRSRLSAPHYLVLEHGEEAEPAFAPLVVVLQDAGCFSATDIFLAAMKELPGVVTCGTASSGGSARSRRYRLPGSGLTIQCASMASWQPDGRFYDGVGVDPDLEFVPRATDLLLDGTDSVLERALEEIGSAAWKKEARRRK